MANTHSRVSKGVRDILTSGQGKVFRLHGHRATKAERDAAAKKSTSLREAGEAFGVVFDTRARFLGIDADNRDEVVWMFAEEWLEDGFPTSRVTRYRDAVLAEAYIQEV